MYCVEDSLSVPPRPVPQMKRDILVTSGMVHNYVDEMRIPPFEEGSLVLSVFQAITKGLFFLWVNWDE